MSVVILNGADEIERMDNPTALEELPPLSYPSNQRESEPATVSCFEQNLHIYKISEKCVGGDEMCNGYES